MRRVAMAGLVLSWALLCGGVTRAESSVVGMRSGDHAGYGRLVLDLPPGISAQAEQEGARVVVRFTPSAEVVEPARMPRNVLSSAVRPGELELALVAGVRLRSARLGDRLVLDLLDRSVVEPRPSPLAVPAKVVPSVRGPAVIFGHPGLVPIDRHVEPADSAPAQAPVAEAAAAAVPPMPVGVARTPVAPVQQTPVQQTPVQQTPVQQTPVQQTPVPLHPSEPAAAPMQLAARPGGLPAGSPGRAASLPFPPGVGVAAFRRGETGVVVFDQRRPIDMAALRDDPLLASAAVQLLPAATVLRLMLAPDRALRLERQATGWSLAVVPAADAAATRDLVAVLADGALRLPTDLAGQVVSVPDPQTGGALLVGTQREAGQAVAITRRMPEFALLQSWQGIVVEPVSDGVVVRVVPAGTGPEATVAGFAIEAGGGRLLSLDAPTAEALLDAGARGFTRRFDFPRESALALRLREHNAVAAAAAAPAQSRTDKRRAAAEAMLALGLGVEAQSVLALTVTADGRGQDNPDLLGLSGVAALVAGRPAEAAGLDDPRLSGSDEVSLWRAVRIAMAREGAPEAAAVFAANLPLLLAYPQSLRDHLLPLAAETIALAGDPGSVRALLDAWPDDHRLDLARGMVEEHANAPAALAVYDRLASGPDRLLRARASARAFELRVAAGQVTAGEAADALDRQLYSWRGDERELAMRQRVAELRARSGGFRPALALLRETDGLWPERHAALQVQMAEIFNAALLQDAAAPVPPLDLVALAEENADLIPGGVAGQALAARLADRLVALDLPRRAIPVLERLASQSPAPPVRAAFGDRLATLRLAQNDAPGALSALAASATADLPPELADSRVLTFARASIAAGQPARALTALQARDTPPARALRASLLEAAQDWPAATAALREQAGREIPSTGALDEAQGRLLLRLAAATAQTGDEVGLAALRDHDLPRLPAGGASEMLRLLTARPVKDAADLPRAARETQLARGLPATLRSANR